MNAISARDRTATILFCVLVALCEGIDLQAAGVAAAGIGAEFKPGPDRFGTFFSASTFGLFLGAVIGGRLADSVGRKKILVVSIGLFGLFSLLTSVAPDVQSLIWARALTGLGLGGALPMLLALVTECSSIEQRNTSVAMVYAVMPLGGAAASLLVMLIATAHWRAIFIVGGVLPLLLVPLMLIGLPESAAFRRAQHSSAQHASTQHASAQHAAARLPAGSLAALFAAGRAGFTLLLWASFFLGLLLLYLLLNWLPSLLVSDGMSTHQAAGAQIGFNLGGVLSAVLVGYLLGGRLRNITVAGIFLSLPVLIVLLAKSPPEFFIVGSIVFVLGCAVLAGQAFLYTVAPIVYPTRIRGMGVGTAVAIGRVGAIVGPKLGGTLKAAAYSPSQLFMELLPLVLAGSLCALWLAWKVGRSNLSAEST